jgi:hypothetical protein
VAAADLAGLELVELLCGETFPWRFSSGVSIFGKADFSRPTLAPECVFLDDVGELDVVVERVEHVEAAVASAGYFLTLGLDRRANARLGSGA